MDVYVDKARTNKVLIGTNDVIRRSKLIVQLMPDRLNSALGNQDIRCL